ncbi:hypothetical protein KOW79_017272 [Hemibagrus wyckioides]|uniref:UBZ1-type domain-containing protein n=1 Tax=Hemibagrus wyckioides TaxID=337641 RepID=A0A9D3SGL6_9TELE|nr:uncharacterized protein zgc:113184 [Hemibagrus wyckioides]KAG7318798.1 hypothetical protein KOW79_017272 [Hemibagrus wyckioides]
MEEAYTALYQEFLRLQLLCLKQAEMLQHLTEALRRQQGAAPVFNGNFEDLYSEPVQCRRDGLELFNHADYRAQAAHFHKQVAHIHTSAAHIHTSAAHTQTSAAHTHTSAAQTHTSAAQTHTSALHPTGVTDDPVVPPLAGALSRLHLEPVQEKEDVDGAASASGRGETEQSSILDELRQVEQRWHTSQRPKQQQQQQQPRLWASSFLTSEMLSEAGGMLMSRVTLHSQVCEFCHAVFPGHTTTRGEFLRHLTTHIS